MSDQKKRYVVIYRSGAAKQGAKLLNKQAGVSFANEANGGEGGFDVQSTGTDPVVMFGLEMAVVTMDEEGQSRVAEASGSDAILVMEEERTYELQTDEPAWDSAPPASGAVGADPSLAAYLQGYVQGVANLAGTLINAPSMAIPVAPFLSIPSGQLQSQLADVAAAGEVTWGLQITNVLNSRLTGRGVRVAILDTGFDFSHPDFQDGRVRGKQFFVTNSAQDFHSHGTHCAGTACGPRTSNKGRYGVATDAEIYIGKVLNDQGSTATSVILSGLDWAVKNKCRVASISIGGRSSPSEVVEFAAQRAINAGTAVIAAAGNNSKRNIGNFQPITDPANCASILSVGSLGPSGAAAGQLRVSDFSNQGRAVSGWSVDIAGPGEGVFSSVPVSKGSYGLKNGTSMATPHVAGIAALIAEVRPDWAGWAIMNTLLSLARPLSMPAMDVGRGLVQAPVE